MACEDTVMVPVSRRQHILQSETRLRCQGCGPSPNFMGSRLNQRPEISSRAPPPLFFPVTRSQIVVSVPDDLSYPASESTLDNILFSTLAQREKKPP